MKAVETAGAKKRNIIGYAKRYAFLLVDVSLVTVAVALSFLFLHGLYFKSVREGTAAAALCVGLIARLFGTFMKPLGNRLFGAEKSTNPPHE